MTDYLNGFAPDIECKACDGHGFTMKLSPAQREAVGDGRVTECPYNHPTGTKCPNCARWPFKKGGALGFVTAVRAALSQEDV